MCIAEHDYQILFEPRHEKTVFFAYAKTKTQISFRKADQHLCFRYWDSTIPLLLTSEF